MTAPPAMQRRRLELAGEQVSKMMMTGQSALALFRAQLKVHDRVRHQADGALGFICAIGCKGPYDAYCTFDAGDTSPVYVRNLIPTWWPWPDVVKSMVLEKVRS